MVLNRAGLVFVALITLISFTVPLTSFAQTDASSTLVSTVGSSSIPALDPRNSVDVEAAVKSYFADIPVMAAIAKCESSFTQYNTNGTVLNGGSGGMIGVFQVNAAVHKTFALSLGDDITTLQGNMAYARYLYDGQGTEPWDSSKSCWGPVAASGSLPAVASSTLEAIKQIVVPSIAQAATNSAVTASAASQSTNAPSATLTQNLHAGSVSSQVVTLQQLLNNAGYFVAKSGAGSPGHETGTFGSGTKNAVERFQCTHNIACSGTLATTGYGLVGAKTRAALMLN